MLALLLALGLATPALAIAPAARAAEGSAVARDSSVRWALVLSGGLARGLAHVGVLRALEEEGLRPDLVVGSSMGSLIGALWASGRTSRQIQEIFERVDAQDVLDPRPSGSWWRGHIIPRPWITLFGAEGWLRLPTGMLDDAALDDLLARHLLDADGLAQGDFRRLRIPWLAVATDLERLVPVVLDSGSVALAVRSSISMPIVLPSVYDGARLLADGGIVSHLPVAVAESDTIDHVLAIDVALSLGTFDERTSAVQIAVGMLQQMSRSGRFQVRPGRDVAIWLPMRGVTPADFRRVDGIVAMGYRATRDSIARLARDWRLPRRPEGAASVVLPRLSSTRWVTPGGRTPRVTDGADRRLGSLPLGRFDPETLASGLARIHRADLFRSVWPRFRVDDDATTLELEVREHSRLEVTAAGGFERDEGGRIAGSMVLRPMSPPWPALLLAGGTWRRFGHSAFASIEPRSLARGANGPFVRAGTRRTETRIFDRDRQWIERATRRGELLAGVQLRLGSVDVVQAGAGVAREWSEGLDRDGAMGVVRLDGPGRVDRMIDAVAFGGERRYASVRGRLAVDVPANLVTLRPAAFAGWASDDAPLDELHSAGGPATLVGFRHREWLGRRALGAELRAIRHLAAAIDLDGYVQAAHVAHPVSRADLADRLHVAAGLGLRMNILFGPLGIDLGVGEGGIRRLEISFGPEF